LLLLLLLIILHCIGHKIVTELRGSFNFALFLEHNYPGKDDPRLPPPDDLSWAKVKLSLSVLFFVNMT
jgi:hypothetical protein